MNVASITETAMSHGLKRGAHSAGLAAGGVGSGAWPSPAFPSM